MQRGRAGMGAVRGDAGPIWPGRRIDRSLPRPKCLPLAGVYLLLTDFGQACVMPGPGLKALLLFAALLPARVAAMEPASACMEAAARAERNWTLPPDLIGAIGRVESGRFNQATGRVSPWPWTVNADGAGHYFASLAEAVAFVRLLQSRGVRLIDIGCFQVDLYYHPAAFASLEEAFDPGANADYAARFLTVLRGRTGSWPAAIAGYHSGLAPEGEGYRQKVMTQWASAGAAVATIADPPGAGRIPARQPSPDPYVVLMSPAARAIPVFGPSAMSGFRTVGFGRRQ